MKKTKTRKMLSNKELAMFCDQIAMILNAGISPMEGISIMMEDSATAEGKEILSDRQLQDYQSNYLDMQEKWRKRKTISAKPSTILLKQAVYFQNTRWI